MKDLQKMFATLFAVSVFLSIVGLLLSWEWSFLKFPVVVGVASFATLFILNQ